MSGYGWRLKARSVSREGGGQNSVGRARSLKDCISTLHTARFLGVRSILSGRSPTRRRRGGTELRQWVRLRPASDIVGFKEGNRKLHSLIKFIRVSWDLFVPFVWILGSQSLALHLPPVRRALERGLIRRHVITVQDLQCGLRTSWLVLNTVGLLNGLASTLVQPRSSRRLMSSSAHEVPSVLTAELTRVMHNGLRGRGVQYAPSSAWLK